VDARWRQGGKWTVRVRYRQLSDDDDNAGDLDAPSAVWNELFVTASESTSTVIEHLSTDRRYIILVDARNEVGYNTSLAARRVIVPDAETGVVYDCDESEFHGGSSS